MYKLPKNGNNFNEKHLLGGNLNMKTNNMKNIIIIKNLPSNLVEEAIVVVKDKKKLSCVDILNDDKNTKEDNKRIIKGFMKSDDFEKIEKVNKENREYVIKEAEMVVNEYLNKIEDNKNYKSREKMEKSYKKIKYINAVLIITSILTTLICFIK